jgi:hypothetical protein
VERLDVKAQEQQMLELPAAAAVPGAFHHLRAVGKDAETPVMAALGRIGVGQAGGNDVAMRCTGVEN